VTTSRLAELVSIGSLFAGAALLLGVVAQPVWTDDLWWHLALGRAYATTGPWLAEDPLLFTAPGAPAPAAWLADVLFYTVQTVAGFPGLRILHTLLVVAIGSLVWSQLRRASGSMLLANLATALFLTSASYRLVQLRPHLFTILASLLLFRWVFESGRAPDRRRATMVVGLLALWANLHAGFVLGPIILCVGLASLALAAWTSSGDLAATSIRATLAILVLGTLASLINPAGVEPYMAYWIAGEQTPSLARVGDEWSRAALFALPERAGTMSWIGLWGSVVATLAGGLTIARRRDPKHIVLFGLACLSLAAMLLAVRFAWLVAFPMLLAAAAAAGREGLDRPLARHGAAAATLALIVAYASSGAGPDLARRLDAGYQRDYPPERYHAHAIWWLDDVDASGRLFAEYSQSGFIGYWLAPQIRTFVNGSLNVTRDAIDANLPIRERRGGQPGERFVDLLDRLGIDLFCGIRLPQPKPGAQPWFHTSAHLEGEPGWIRVFRNLDSAIYLRDLPRNQGNLKKISSYYRERAIPFDPLRGFEPVDAITHAPTWSMQQGVVPSYFDDLAPLANNHASPRRLQALGLLAKIHAALGDYETAIDYDRALLKQRPLAVAPQQRVIWSLLRLRRYADAQHRAAAFAAEAPTDPLSRSILALASVAAEGEPDAEELASRIARLPVFTPDEAARLRGAMRRPAVR